MSSDVSFSIPFQISKPSEQKVARTALESLFGEDEVLVTGEEFITPAELARKEVESYKGHKPASLKENPLKWWKENEVYFPKLARLARTYFCVQATSVASERVFLRLEPSFMQRGPV